MSLRAQPASWPSYRTWRNLGSRGAGRGRPYHMQHDRGRISGVLPSKPASHGGGGSRSGAEVLRNAMKGSNRRWRGFDSVSIKTEVAVRGHQGFAGVRGNRPTSACSTVPRPSKTCPSNPIVDIVDLENLQSSPVMPCDEFFGPL